MIRRLLVLALLCCPAWAYQYCAPLTPTAASSGTLTNFTQVFTGNDVKFKLAPTGVIQHTITRNGIVVPTDFVITTDSNGGPGTIAFKWNFEDGGTTSGTPIVYVKFPSLTTTPPTIYGCIGDASVTTYQGGTSGEDFDSSTLNAYHLADGSTLSATDFKGSNNGSTTGASATVGKIGGAASLNGTADRITFSQIINSTTFSLEAWIKPTRYGNAASGNGFFYQGTGTGQEGLALMVYTDGSTHLNTLRWSAGGGSYTWASNNAITLNVWQHVVMTYNAGSITFYVNGVSVGTGSATNGSYAASAFIGFWYDSSASARYFAGAIDEHRYRNRVLSAAEVATYYANQNSPPAFGTFTAVSISPAFAPAAVY